ncbi:MAG: oxygen-independent coproporphyrinogen III oxidase [Acidobacteriota bacterium]|nr:oxygen-independent coproporphyrinogen III oxidase [Acidobacteriota bacterium]MDQ2980087.1 oxygen-independent coproporphyrinogen III oxidase [Acidobacteriota bacterium]
MSSAPATNVGPISVEMLGRYNVAGPRYTSYPTAPVWHEGVGAGDYESFLLESARAPDPAPLSLYLHLPFCEKLCYFCGCTVVITGADHGVEDAYLESLAREIEWVSRRAGADRPVVQLHLGGGTPTYFAPERLERLVLSLRERFRFADDAELGVEVDPRVTTPEHLATLARAGFNRLSLGVQDFDPEVQAAINRIQPYADTRRLVEEARRLRFPSINMDLIFGLPFQTPRSFSATIDRVLEIAPDRLAVYSYANVPWMKKHQRILEPHLPDERTKFEIFQTALERFQEAGFEYIGMDHFARPDDELARARRSRTLHRNFQGYTTKAGTDLIGIGMSAIGEVGDGYVQNQRDLAPYRSAVARGGAATFRGFRLSFDDRLRRAVIQSLLCHGVVVKAEIEREFHIGFDETFAGALERLRPCADDGLVELLDGEVRATGIGRVFLRNLAMPFDAYLTAPADKPVFSKTL